MGEGKKKRRYAEDAMREACCNEEFAFTWYPVQGEWRVRFGDQVMAAGKTLVQVADKLVRDA